MSFQIGRRVHSDGGVGDDGDEEEKSLEKVQALK